MTDPPVTDPAGDGARARRRFIAEHHPDRGGDPDAFARGLAAFDAPPPAQDLFFYRRPTGLRRLVGAVTRARGRRSAPPRVR